MSSANKPPSTWLGSKGVCCSSTISQASLTSSCSAGHFSFAVLGLAHTQPSLSYQQPWEPPPLPWPPSVPCTGIVTVCPLFAVTVAVATVTKVCPGTGVTGMVSEVTFCTGSVLTMGCCVTLTGVRVASLGVSLSTNSLRRVGLPVGELYLSYRVVGEEDRPANFGQNRIRYNLATESC